MMDKGENLPPLDEVFSSVDKQPEKKTPPPPPPITPPQASLRVGESGEQIPESEKVAPHWTEREGVNLTVIRDAIWGLPEERETKRKAKQEKREEQRKEKIGKARAKKVVREIDKSIRPEERKKKWRNRFIAAILGIPTGLVGKMIIDAARKKKEVGTTTVLGPKEFEEQQENFDDTNLNLYSREGMKSSQLDISGINSPDHLNEAPYSLYGTPVYNLTAKFGPSWLLAYTIDDNGKETEKEISQVAFKDMVDQLGLQNNPQGQQVLRENWVAAHDNPQIALNLINGTLIPGTTANQQVVNFYKCSLDVYNKDTDKTWQERLPKVEACAAESKNLSTPTPQVEAEIDNRTEVNYDSFVNLAEYVLGKSGGNIESLGALETAANTPIDVNMNTTALALDVADLYHESNGPLESGFNPLPMVLSGLLLLRVGPRWPKDLMAGASKIIEDTYYWFKLRQGEKVMRNLMVLGQKLINPKVNQ